MLKFYSWFAVAALASILLAQAPVAVCQAADDAESVCRKRFDSDARAGWARLENSAQSVAGEIKYTRDFRNAGGEKWADSIRYGRVVRFWRTPTGGKLITESRDQSGKWTKGSAYAYNPQYAFALKQPVDTGAYIVTVQGRDEETIRKIKAMVQSDLDFLDASHSLRDVESRRLSDIVEDPGFQMLSCKDVVRDEKNLIEVAFRLSLRGTSAWRSPLLVTVVLDPARNWRIVQSSVEDSDMTIRADLSYAAGSADPARVSAFKSHAHSKDGKAEDIVAAALPSVSFGPIPPDSIYLTAFGFPEIASKGSNRNWRMIIIGGNLLLVGAVLYFIYYRRKRRNEASKRGSAALLALGLLLPIGSPSVAALESGPATSPASCAHRFREDAPAGLMRIARSLQTVSGTMVWSREIRSQDGSKSPRNIVEQQVRDFWLSDAGAKLVQTSVDSSGRQTRIVDCLNVEYAFIASQNMEGAPYVLNDYGRGGPLMEKARSYVDGAMAPLRQAYQAPGDIRPLGETINSDDFKLLTCDYIEQSGRRLVEATIEFNPTGWYEQRDPSRRKVKLVLDPAADWRIVHIAGTDLGYAFTSDLTYVPGSAEPSRIARVVYRSVSPDGKTASASSSEVTSLNFGPTPPSEFRLASVGLPEVATESHKRLWRLLLIAGTFMVFALLLFVLYRRQRGTAAVHSNTSQPGQV